MSSNAYSQSYDQELELDGLESLNPPVPLDLELVDPIETNINGVEMFAWDIESYRILMQIYAGYDLWASTYINEQYEDLHYELRLDNCSQRLDLTKDVLEKVTTDREFAYKQYFELKEDLKKEQFRGKIKYILIGTGSGLVGVAFGFIIGILTTK